MVWTPLAGPNDEDASKEIRDIDTDEDFLNHSWAYRVEIKGATDLPVFCEMAYIQYTFLGETFTSEAVQQTTFSPVFDYSKVHSVNNATKDFLDFLKGPLEISIHVTQHVDPPSDRIGTANEIVRDSIRTGEALGYRHVRQSFVTKPPNGSSSSTNLSGQSANETGVGIAGTNKEISEIKQENEQLKNKVKELEEKLQKYEEQSKKSKILNDARVTDAVLSETV